MMVNFDIATAREFMFCTWPQIRMERLFLQLIKKKLTSLEKFSPLNYHKTLSSPLSSPSTKISEKICPTNMPYLTSCLTWKRYLYRQIQSNRRAHLEPCHRNPDTLAEVRYCVIQLNYGEKCIHAGQRCHRSNGLVATVLDF